MKFNNFHAQENKYQYLEHSVDKVKPEERIVFEIYELSKIFKNFFQIQYEMELDSRLII